jgi:hypothetical protein
MNIRQKQKKTTELAIIIVIICIRRRRFPSAMDLSGLIFGFLLLALKTKARIIP